MDFKKTAGAGIIGVLTLLQYYVHSKRRKILEELERMPTPTNAREAHGICKRFYWQYFPFVATKALEFGLFKTYGKLCCQSKLSNHDTHSLLTPLPQASQVLV